MLSDQEIQCVVNGLPSGLFVVCAQVERLLPQTVVRRHQLSCFMFHVAHRLTRYCPKSCTFHCSQGFIFATSMSFVPDGGEEGRRRAGRLRQMEERLFLEHMASLATDMCRRYGERSPPTDAEFDSGVDQTHVELFAKDQLDDIRRRVAEAVRAQASHGTTPLRGDRESNTTLPLNARHTKQNDAHRYRLAMGATTGDDEWHGAASSGVAARLRDSRGRGAAASTYICCMGFPGREAGRMGGSTASSLPYGPLHIRRFDDLAKAATLSMLDLNMDGNTHCLSARRPHPPTDMQRATERLTTRFPSKVQFRSLPAFAAATRHPRPPAHLDDAPIPQKPFRNPTLTARSAVFDRALDVARVAGRLPKPV